MAKEKSKNPTKSLHEATKLLKDKYQKQDTINDVFLAPRFEKKPKVRHHTYTLRELLKTLESLAKSNPKSLDREVLLEEDSENFPVDFVYLQNGQVIIQSVSFEEPLDYFYKDKDL